MPRVRQATGPGRINLIGDHTDYNLGLAMPMAIDLGVTVTFTPGARGPLRVSSSAFGGTVELPAHLDPTTETIRAVEPAWGRLVAAMVALDGPLTGGRLDIATTVPVGAGLSSSAALSVALAEVLDGTASVQDIARLGQEAEHLAGAPVGAMDPLVCAGAVAGHALLIDCSDLSHRQVPVPPGIDLVAVDSGQRRSVRSSAYGTRVAESAEAAAQIGSLGRARLSDVSGIDDPVLRRRARHVVTECRPRPRLRRCLCGR